MSQKLLKQKKFEEVYVIVPDMFRDHLPDLYDDALNGVLAKLKAKQLAAKSNLQQVEEVAQ